VKSFSNGAKNGRARYLLGSVKKQPVVLILIVISVAFSICFPDRFLTYLNISSIVSQFVTIMLFALGPSIVAAMGSMDLTYIGIWMLGGIVLWRLTPTLGPAAILVIPVLGVVTGWLVGVIQVKAKIPSFILTLSLLVAYSGLTSLLSGGYPRIVRGYEFITAPLIPYVPTELVWTVPLIGAAVFIMRSTKVGTYLYAIGSNEEGAQLAGIDVQRYKILAFTISGLFTGLGSVIQFQHLGGSVPLALNLNTMVSPLVAIVLGGTLLTGGSGGPDRTILGALTYVVLYRGLYISFLSPEVLQLLTGLLLVVSVVIASRELRSVIVT